MDNNQGYQPYQEPYGQPQQQQQQQQQQPQQFAQPVPQQQPQQGYQSSQPGYPPQQSSGVNPNWSPVENERISPDGRSFIRFGDNRIKVGLLLAPLIIIWGLSLGVVLGGRGLYSFFSGVAIIAQCGFGLYLLFTHPKNSNIIVEYPTTVPTLVPDQSNGVQILRVGIQGVGLLSHGIWAAALFIWSLVFLFAGHFGAFILLLFVAFYYAVVALFSFHSTMDEYRSYQEFHAYNRSRQGGGHIGTDVNALGSANDGNGHVAVTVNPQQSYYQGQQPQFQQQPPQQQGYVAPAAPQ